MMWLLLTVKAVYYLFDGLKSLRIIDNVTLYIMLCYIIYNVTLYITGAVFYRHAVDTNLMIQNTSIYSACCGHSSCHIVLHIPICTRDTCTDGYFLVGKECGQPRRLYKGYTYFSNSIFIMCRRK